MIFGIALGNFADDYYFYRTHTRSIKLRVWVFSILNVNVAYFVGNIDSY